MTEKSIQEQLDQQIEGRRTAEVVDASELPSLSSDIFERDDRESAIAEVNFKDMSARLVEMSDAPEVTVEVLETLGKPVKTVEMFYETGFWQVKVRDGVPIELDIRRLQLLSGAGEPATIADREALDGQVQQLIVSEMISDPSFSFQGQGEGTPIENRSPVLIASLWEAHAAVNNPVDDMIYQVQVSRGTPEDAYALTGETHEWYPVGAPTKPYTEMAAEELALEMQRYTARRRAILPVMIASPGLSYSDDVSGQPGYPVGLLSERFLRTLYEAHRVVNVPAAGLASLQRFLRANANPEGSSASRDALGDE